MRFNFHVNLYIRCKKDYASSQAYKHLNFKLGIVCVALSLDQI